MTDNITDNITLLEPEKWENYRLEFHYISHHYYDVSIDSAEEGFTVSFVKKPFETPYEKMPDNTDKLFQSWWDDIKAWGIVKDDRLIAVIETAVEGWSNRLRVTELWVDDGYRKQGIGTALMNIAKRRAKEEKRRTLMLETQSCNENAVAFYLAQGFSLIGFNACEYQNNDIARREVRMELGILLD